jgi:hypothetical protein
MANTLSAVVPKLLAQALPVLRQNAIMARLVNRAYDAMAAQLGSSIDVPVSATIAAQQVTPGNTPPATADIAPTVVNIPLDQWYEAPFYLTDKEMQEVMAGTIPMQASEAVKAIANQVDTFILGFYKDFYGFAGTPGTTPFTTGSPPDLTDALSARTVLNQQLAPPNDRRIVLDPVAEGKALNLRALQDASWRGNAQAVNDGMIGKAVGMDWYMDQNVLTHTSTPLTAGAATVNGVTTVGQGSTDGGETGTISIAKITNTSPLIRGDILTFAGDSQTYVVVSDVTLAVGNTTVTIAPAKKVATVGGEAVTLKASHVANMVFHPQAIAFATRPLDNNNAGELGSIIESVVDPISGLTLRLEVRREHRRTRWAFDILYGGKTVRRRLGARLAG